MTARYAELPMYVAPENIAVANERWLGAIAQRLSIERLPMTDLSLAALWQHPRLLLAQTCGYPLMTLLQGHVRLIGRPHYELPDARAGFHCSLILARADDPRQDLGAFAGCRGVINSPDSNTGMNLLRHSIAPYQRGGQFFSSLKISGGHRESLRWLRDGRAELAAVDSVTFAYLQRDAGHEVGNLRIVARTAGSPTLPFIAGLDVDADDGETLRSVMNETLQLLPDVSQTLGLVEVLPAREEDYQILLAYERQAATLGLEYLNPD